MPSHEEELRVSYLQYSSNHLNSEALIIRPAGKGPFPGVVFIHGHASDSWKSLWFGYQLTQFGFACLLPTQRGYGFSQGGTPDFCGPATVQAVLDGIALFREKAFVDSRRIGIWGISRGATVAGLTASIKPRTFRALVLQSGTYDLEMYVSGRGSSEIKATIINEIGKSKYALRIRSLLPETKRLSCPILILHGEQDERVPADQARALDARLNELKKEHRTVLVPGAGHFITQSTFAAYTIPFLKAALSHKREFASRFARKTIGS